MTDEAREGNSEEADSEPLVDADPHAGTAELVIHELKDLRNKQDRQLDGLRRLGVTALIVILTTGTIAVAVDDNLAATTAVIILGCTLVIGGGLGTIELFAGKWSTGPKIDPLIRRFSAGRPTLLDLQLVIIKGLRTDYARNAKRLDRIKLVVFVQALSALATITILLLGFRELP